MKNYFMPLGVLVAIAIAIVVPQPGRWLEEAGLVQWLVVLIFLINGFQTRLQSSGNGNGNGKGYLRLIILAIIINLLVAPWIGWLVVTFIPLSVDMSVGLLVMAAVPATLSSGIVMTRIAGGDTTAALTLTILLNIIGVFTIPLLLMWTLGSAGLIELSVWPLLQQLALLVLLPFTVGMLLRRISSYEPPAFMLGYLPSACVISTVWMLMSRSNEALASLVVDQMLLVVAASLILHGVLLLICWGGGVLWIEQMGRRKALLFTCSQKTLPVAISVMAAMDLSAGVALVSCILYHFLQLLVDSFLAARLAGSQ